MRAHVQEHLSAFMDGALSASEQSAIQEHLRVCPSCTRLLEELSAVDDAVRALPVDAPAGYFDTFAGRVRRRLEKEHRAATPRPMPRWAWALAAGLLLAVVTPLTVRRIQGPEAAPTDLSRPGGADRQEPERGAGETRAPAPALAVPAPTPESTPPPPEKNAPALRDPDPSRLRKDERPESGLRGTEQAFPKANPREEAPKRPAAAAAAETDGLKAQTAPPAFQEDQRVLRDQDAPAAPAAVAQQQAESREQPRKLEETRDQGGGEAEGKVSRFAREPSSAPPSEQGGRRRSVERARPSEPVAAPPSRVEAEYARLQRRSAPDLAAARALREAWRTFGLRYPDSPYADEARVRTIAAGAEAVRMGGDPADRELMERDATGYLEGDASKQRERVRTILEQQVRP